MRLVDAPVVGAEGGDGNAVVVEDRADAPVAETVADGDGLGHFLTPDIDAVFFLAQLGLGLVEHLVGAGNLEPGVNDAHRCQTLFVDIEADRGLPLVESDALVGRADRIDALEPVVPSGALSIGAPDWKLRFQPDKCVVCKLCITACPLKLFHIEFAD